MSTDMKNDPQRNQQDQYQQHGAAEGGTKGLQPSQPIFSGIQRQHQKNVEELRQEYHRMTTFYGVEMRQLFGDVHNAMLIISSDCLAQTEEHIIESLQKRISTKDLTELKDQISQCCRLFENTMFKAVSLGSDGFEQYALPNIFMLPPNLDPNVWKDISSHSKGTSSSTVSLHQNTSSISPQTSRGNNTTTSVTTKPATATTATTTTITSSNIKTTTTTNSETIAIREEIPSLIVPPSIHSVENIDREVPKEGDEIIDKDDEHDEHEEEEEEETGECDAENEGHFSEADMIKLRDEIKKSFELNQQLRKEGKSLTIQDRYFERNKHKLEQIDLLCQQEHITLPQFKQSLDLLIVNGKKLYQTLMDLSRAK